MQTDKILEGCRLAIERMLEQKRITNSYVVISKDGKVVKVKAADILKERDLVNQ